MKIIATEADIEEGLSWLLTVEPRFARVVETHGRPSLRREDSGLAGLLRIVTDQLISLKAGEAIWKRLEAELHPFEPERLARRREATLMRIGLSGAKARCFIACARAAAKGEIDFVHLHTLSDAEAIAALTALPGIGPWTADIYLLSNMGRADSWPAGDLALQAAAHDLLGLSARPDHKSLLQIAEPWRPWRAVAARLLWSHYRGLRGMKQAP
ncbi:MAG: DNA-3-methyladenine glycosylase family protein [Aestuariivirga sp.]